MHATFMRLKAPIYVSNFLNLLVLSSPPLLQQYPARTDSERLRLYCICASKAPFTGRKRERFDAGMERELF